MEQLFGYPEASDAARLSYEGIVELIAFPAALLIILGLFTRPVSGSCCPCCTSSCSSSARCSAAGTRTATAAIRFC